MDLECLTTCNSDLLAIHWHIVPKQVPIPTVVMARPTITNPTVSVKAIIGSACHRYFWYLSCTKSPKVILLRLLHLICRLLPLLLLLGAFTSGSPTFFPTFRLDMASYTTVEAYLLLGSTSLMVGSLKCILPRRSINSSSTRLSSEFQCPL